MYFFLTRNKLKHHHYSWISTADFKECAEGLKWSALTEKIIKTTLKIKQYLRIKIQLWNSLQPLGDSILIYA